MPEANATTLTSLLFGDGNRWNAGKPLGTPVTITYAFQDHVPANPVTAFGDAASTFEAFNETMRAGTRALLDYVQQVCGVTFVEVGETASNVGIRFSGTSLEAGNCIYGFATVPVFDSSGTPLGINASGDETQIWINFARTLNIRGQDFYNQAEAILHEIGHVLGLKHPNEGATAEQLPATLQTEQQSIMLAAPQKEAAWFDTLDQLGRPWFQEGYMQKPTMGILDIDALRTLYGSPAHATVADDVYKFTDQPVFQTILDNGGTDTIDASGAKFDSTIDLHAGALSSIAHRTFEQYTAKLGTEITSINDSAAYFNDRLKQFNDGGYLYLGEDNVGIATGSVIENAIGGAGGDRITGNDIANTLSGMAGDDRIQGDGGNDAIDGGAGMDTALFRDARSAYTIRSNADGTITVTGARDGTDTLRNVEALQFADKTSLALRADDAPVARLYGAAFGRMPDLAGLNVQLDALHHGTSLKQLAANFLGSAEFKARYGTSASDADFVNALYQNVLGRAADAGGMTTQMNALSSATVTRADLLLNFAGSAENQAKTAADWLLLV